MEFADAGDLLQKVAQHRRQGSHFQEAELWRLFLEVTKGLRALHALQILHRDLKSANVFLFRDGRIKLGDMNVSKVAKAGLVYTQTGTPYYASPEVWRDQPYDLKSDIWSLGCVLYEAAALQPPFRAHDMSALYRKVMKGEYPPLPVFYSHDLNLLLKAMLQVSPLLRPNCEKLLLLPAVGRNLHLQAEDYTSDSQNLLGTIRLPRTLTALSERLPAPAYLRKTRNSSMPLSSKKSLFRPNPLASSASTSFISPIEPVPEEHHPASVKLPPLKPVLSPMQLPALVPKQVSLARQIEAIKAKYERVRPGIFQPRPAMVTGSTVLPSWWG